MYELQKTVVIRDKTLHITNDGDYRMVLDCFNALNDEEISEDARVLASLLIFYNEFNSIEDLTPFKEDIEILLNEMFKFMNCGQNDSVGARTEKPLVDWKKDEQIICAAINNVANTEIRALPYVHWWTFMGYYLSVGESVLSTVISIRDKIVKHKKLEKWEKDFKRDNPDYFVWRTTTVQERDIENAIRDLWNKE